MNELFNFCIGRPWTIDPTNIHVYRIYNADVHYGDMRAAKNALEYVENETEQEHFIYKLVKVECD